MDRLKPQHLPPTSALRALEAAARHLSFTAAAQELNVTQSAISHQIKALEQAWGLPLFERVGRGLRLTPAGKDFAQIAARFIEDLTTTLQRHQNTPLRQSLRISTVQSFATKWLVPRLHDFQVQHPGVDVWISASEDLVDLGRPAGPNRVDAAIRLSQRRFPGLAMTPLLTEQVFPVCSPAFIARWGKPRRPEDLRDLPLLLRNQDRGVPTWADWFEHVGLRDIHLDHGIRFLESSLAIQAALDGHGIALARSAHLSDELSRGNLVRLFRIPFVSPLKYFFVCRQDRAREPAIAAFRDWIVGQAQQTQEEIDRDTGPQE